MECGAGAFGDVLAAVLAVGNEMNAGTSRGQASGFKLESLLKLADVKGVDRKTSLLHFVLKQMLNAEGGSDSDDSDDSDSGEEGGKTPAPASKQGPPRRRPPSSSSGGSGAAATAARSPPSHRASPACGRQQTCSSAPCER